jgi:hypothetical protein
MSVLVPMVPRCAELTLAHDPNTIALFFCMRLHMARRCLVSTDQTMNGGPHLLILRLCMQVVEKLMEGEDSSTGPRDTRPGAPPPPVHYPWSSPPPIPTSPSTEHQVCIFIIIYLLLVIL